VVQSGFQNLSLRIRNNILSEEGDKKRGFWEILNTIGDGLVHKNLLKPPNWNILFDLLCLLFILILGFCTPSKEFPLKACVITGLVLVCLCFGWVFYYVQSLKK